MKIKKARKPRGIKKNGHRSLDMCPDCLSFYCDPMRMSSKFRDKVNKRRDLGVCPSCGAKPCKCKSTLDRIPDLLTGRPFTIYLDNGESITL